MSKLSKQSVESARMLRNSGAMLWVCFILLGALAAHAGSKAKSKAAGATHPVRVHYSGNLEGELEPCG